MQRRPDALTAPPGLHGQPHLMPSPCLHRSAQADGVATWRPGRGADEVPCRRLLEQPADEAICGPLPHEDPPRQAVTHDCGQQWREAADVGPVDDVPERLGVGGLVVLVLQVKGVLPHIQHEQRLGTAREVALMVVQLLDHQPLTQRLPCEDRPARPLHGRGRCGEVRTEGID